MQVLNTTTLRYHVVGIVSWGYGCKHQERIGVYGNVKYFMRRLVNLTKDACYCS